MPKKDIEENLEKGDLVSRMDRKKNSLATELDHFSSAAVLFTNQKPGLLVLAGLSWFELV